MAEATIGLRGDCDRILGRASRRRGDRVPDRGARARGGAGPASVHASPARARCARGSRHRPPLPPPGADLRGERARRARGRRDGNRERQDARVQPACAERPRRRAEAARALPLPHEGAGPGSGTSTCGAQGSPASPGDLRRRHRDGAALADPQVGERHPLQPRHAPRGRPSAPRPLGRRPPEPALRHRRRGTRLPRRVRLARRQRAAALAARRADLRSGSSVPARIRDDRQSRRARFRSDRPTGDRGRRRHRLARGSHDRLLEPAAPRRGDGVAGERAR